MTALTAHVLLALLWVFVTGSFSLATWLAGALVGYLILWVTSPLTGWKNYPSWPWRTVRFVILYTRELLLAGLRIAHDVLTPGLRNKPAIVTFPLEARTPFEITMVANLISLSPGSLCLDVSSDHRALHLHVMGANTEDLPAFVDELKRTVETPALELVRGTPSGTEARTAA